MWRELEKVNIRNKKKYIKIFRELMKKIGEGDWEFKEEKTEFDDYYIINEKINCEKYANIVPKQLKDLFEKMRREHPKDFLGFTVLINDIRVSCFGIPCSELSKAIIGE